jgi:hypothetical protein
VGTRHVTVTAIPSAGGSRTSGYTVLPASTPVTEGRRTGQNLVLLVQRAEPPLGLPLLALFRTGRSGRQAVRRPDASSPAYRRTGDTEVSSDLLNRLARLTGERRSRLRVGTPWERLEHGAAPSSGALRSPQITSPIHAAVSVACRSSIRYAGDRPPSWANHRNFGRWLSATYRGKRPSRTVGVGLTPQPPGLTELPLKSATTNRPGFLDDEETEAVRQG